MKINNSFQNFYGIFLTGFHGRAFAEDGAVERRFLIWPRLGADRTEQEAEGHHHKQGTGSHCSHLKTMNNKLSVTTHSLN